MPHTIRLLYGHSIAKELIHIETSSKNEAKDADDMDEDDSIDDPEAWKAEAHVTNANYHAKKTVFLLFINRKAFLCRHLLVNVESVILDRLVESSRMKRAFEAVYNGILPKGAFPFIYLRSAKYSCALFPTKIVACSLEIDPRSVDVNVHPTKREVHFLNEDTIVEKISDTIQQALAAKNHSRAFEYQVSNLVNSISALTRMRIDTINGRGCWR